MTCTLPPHDLTECKQQENDNAYSYHTTKNDRVSSLPEVDLLNNTIDERKASCWVELGILSNILPPMDLYLTVSQCVCISHAVMACIADTSY